MGVLEGRAAVVLGVGPGLGRSIALRLAAEGADLLLVARGEQSLAAVADEAAEHGGRVVTRRADITSAADRSGLAHTVREELGGVDVLVANAFTPGPTIDVADADLERWREVMEVNVWGPIAVVQQLLPSLRSSAGGASIVMVSAMTTRTVSSRGRAGYAMSKAALNQAVHSMAYEFGRDRIRVNAVVPGWMAGPTTEAWLADPATRGHVEAAVAAIPLGELPTTEDVAGSVAYLASDLSRSVTGVLLDTNGGQFMNS